MIVVVARINGHRCRVVFAYDRLSQGIHNAEQSSRTRTNGRFRRVLKPLRKSGSGSSR